MRLRKYTALIVTVLLLAAAACGGTTTTVDTTTTGTADTTTSATPVTTTTTVDDTATPDDTTTAAVADTITTTTVDDTATTTQKLISAEWETVPGDDSCACADGSEFFYHIREQNPAEVVFYLGPGGACFNSATCDFENGTYRSSILDKHHPDNYGGIFDFDNPANPLKDHSFVYVPYCTGDVHLGDNTKNYSDGLQVRHNGYVNASVAMETMKKRFPEAEHVVVAGSSAGSAATPLYAGIAADMFPEAAITVISDASGSYPSTLVVNTIIGGQNWGTASSIQDWPVNAGIATAEWGLVEIYIQAGKHAPRIRFARFNHAFDIQQQTFTALAGFKADELDQAITQNGETIEDAGVNIMDYLASGEEHTILDHAGMYTLETEGVPFLSWLTDILKGETVDDVICQSCT